MSAPACCKFFLTLLQQEALPSDRQPPIQAEELNADAQEALTFMNGMASCLREGIRHDSPRVAELIRIHLEFAAGRERPVSPADFAGQAKFFLQDDFHRGMLEAQQTGLSYYLAAAADAYASGHHFSR